MIPITLHFTKIYEDGRPKFGQSDTLDLGIELPEETWNAVRGMRLRISWATNEPCLVAAMGIKAQGANPAEAIERWALRYMRGRGTLKAEGELSDG